jgi:hypothetical protein
VTAGEGGGAAVRKASATSIALNFFGNDLALTPGGVAWFTFALAGSADVSVSMMSFDFQPMVALFGPSLERVAGPGWGFTATLAAGTYQLAVSSATDPGFVGDHAEAGSYALHVTAPPGRRRTTAAFRR